MPITPAIPNGTVTQLLANNGTRGFSNVIVGSGLAYNSTTKELSTGGGGMPGGSNTQVQRNNAGAFGGITGATSDGTTMTLTTPVLTGLPTGSGVASASTASTMVSRDISGISSFKQVNLDGLTSGSAAIKAPAVAGSTVITLPISPTNGYAIKTDASGIWSYFEAVSAYATINNQTGLTYTLATSDNSNLIVANNAAAQTYTLPSQATTALTLGYKAAIFNKGNGAITFVKMASDVIASDNIVLQTGATCRVILIAITAGVNTWLIEGGSSSMGGNIGGVLTGVVANAIAYPLLRDSNFRGTISGITIDSSNAGAIPGTFTIAINGVAVTGLTNVVTGLVTPVSYTATAANTFQNGDNITITFSGTTAVTTAAPYLKFSSYQNIE